VESAAVVLLLLDQLSSPHLGRTVSMDLSEFSSTGTSFLFVDRSRGFGFLIREHSGILAVCCEEWRDAGGFRGLVIGSKFCSCQPIGPIVLDVVDIAPKVLLHDRIRSFCLSVSLWVEGC